MYKGKAMTWNLFQCRAQYQEHLCKIARSIQTAVLWIQGQGLPWIYYLFIYFFFWGTETQQRLWRTLYETMSSVHTDERTTHSWGAKEKKRCYIILCVFSASNLFQYQFRKKKTQAAHREHPSNLNSLKTMCRVSFFFLQTCSALFSSAW